MSRAVSRPAGATATLRRDVASAMLYLAPMQALITLVSFIAINRLDASLAWVGILGSAGYWGQLWNLALGRVTAKVDLRSGLALLMAAQGLLLGAARDRLVPVYGWFTEGFDTADLKNAKALLDALR